MNKLRMLTPGPTPLPENVRLALSRDMLHHRKDEFKKIMAENQAGLRYLFGTREPVLTLSSSGTGAMVAAVTNLFAPGEKVLVVEGGKFGQRWSDIAQSHGLEVVALPVEWGQAITKEEVENALSRWPDIQGVLVQASETSTGVLHPIKDLAELCQAKDKLLVVDGISAVGISPCPMDKWGIDCLLTGSQKGLMLPPGLAFIALSPKAWERVKAIGPKSFYFNLLKEKARSLQNQTNFTPAINLIVGLKECLEYFKLKGLKNIYKKQKALTEMTRAGVTAIGLEPLVKDDYTLGLTSVLLPPGIDGVKVLKVAAQEYGVVMAGGQDQLKGKIVRIGHMGYVDWSDILAGLYALRQAFVACGGHSGSRDYLEQAMSVYEKVISEPENN
ncbi:alanine--glyoxylate aminotransferase family protein [Desulfohalobiaceae bacterium Ax17]|nr:alanine--glyoxylate aminotransferase family protein [Desulfovulcanus ferrireducens]